MTGATSLAELAGLLADETRAQFCLALLDGRAWTAGELARYTGVSPATATEHLNRLVAGGLVIDRKQGRHRYVQLADQRVAELLEGLVGHLRPTPSKARTLRSVSTSEALAVARTCYDHLAGRLGVAITDAMAGHGFLDQDNGFALTNAGIAWLNDELGITSDELRGTRRPVARACLDWTERRSHLAGSAGAHLCRRFLENQWIKRIGSSRAIRLTPTGEHALRELLGIDAARISS